MILLASARKEKRPPAGASTPTEGLTTRSVYLLMADENPTDQGATASEDDRDQAAVLTHVLMLHPTRLTVPDLVREIGAGAEGFDRSDRIERAVRDLTAVGLLHSAAGLALPTHAAIRFDQLLGG